MKTTDNATNKQVNAIKNFLLVILFMFSLLFGFLWTDAEKDAATLRQTSRAYVKQLEKDLPLDYLDDVEAETDAYYNYYQSL